MTLTVLQYLNRVRDGMIKNVSVGFRVLEHRVTVDPITDRETVIITRWELFETTLVLVPADRLGSGFTRSENKSEELLDIETPVAKSALDKRAVEAPKEVATMSATTPETTPESERAKPAVETPETQTRAETPAVKPAESRAGLSTMLENATRSMSAVGVEETEINSLRNRAINGEVSPSEFRAEQLKLIDAAAARGEVKPDAPKAPAVVASLKRTDMDNGEWSLQRALELAHTGRANDTSTLEGRANAEENEKNVALGRGIVSAGNEVFLRADLLMKDPAIRAFVRDELRREAAVNRLMGRAQSFSQDGTGAIGDGLGSEVFDPNALIQAFRPDSSLLSLVRMDSQTHYNSVTETVETGAGTATWVAENATTSGGASGSDVPSYNTKRTWEYHEVQREVDISRFALANSRQLAERIMFILRNVLPEALDRAIIRGSGTAGEPQGILNWLASNDGANYNASFGTSYVINTNAGGGPSVTNLEKLFRMFDELRCDKGDGATVILTSGSGLSAMRQEKRDTGSGRFIVENGPDSAGASYNGVPIAKDNNVPVNFNGTKTVPSNDTKQTANNTVNHTAVAVLKPMELEVKRFGEISLVVDPFTARRSGNVQYAIIGGFDVQQRRNAAVSAHDLSYS